MFELAQSILVQLEERGERLREFNVCPSVGGTTVIMKFSSRDQVGTWRSRDTFEQESDVIIGRDPAWNSLLTPPQEGRDLFLTPPQEGGDSFLATPQKGGSSFHTSPQEGGGSFHTSPQEGGESSLARPPDGAAHQTRDPDRGSDRTDCHQDWNRLSLSTPLTGGATHRPLGGWEDDPHTLPQPATRDLSNHGHLAQYRTPCQTYNLQTDENTRNRRDGTFCWAASETSDESEISRDLGSRDRDGTNEDGNEDDDDLTESDNVSQRYEIPSIDGNSQTMPSGSTENTLETVGTCENVQRDEKVQEEGDADNNNDGEEGKGHIDSSENNKSTSSSAQNGGKSAESPDGIRRGTVSDEYFASRVFGVFGQQRKSGFWRRIRDVNRNGRVLRVVMGTKVRVPNRKSFFCVFDDIIIEIHHNHHIPHSLSPWTYTKIYDSWLKILDIKWAKRLSPSHPLYQSLINVAMSDLENKMERCLRAHPPSTGAWHNHYGFG